METPLKSVQQLQDEQDAKKCSVLIQTALDQFGMELSVEYKMTLKKKTIMENETPVTPEVEKELETPVESTVEAPKVEEAPKEEAPATISPEL